MTYCLSLDPKRQSMTPESNYYMALNYYQSLQPTHLLSIPIQPINIETI